MAKFLINTIATFGIIGAMFYAIILIYGAWFIVEKSMCASYWTKKYGFKVEVNDFNGCFIRMNDGKLYSVEEMLKKGY